jgi:hypothetical protein
MTQWDALSPALRLASRMTQQPTVWKWYAHVLCEDIAIHGESAVIRPSVESVLVRTFEV